MSDDSVVKVFEQQQVKLKLSDAIRIGARIRPQCRLDPFRDGKSCAIGAAYEGATGEYNEEMDMCDIRDELRIRGIWPLTLPTSAIWPLNDCERWSREQIADWLEAQGY